MRPTSAGSTRILGLAAVVAAVGLLPWLSHRDPALTVLRARSAEQEATEEALTAIREDLGLDAGPLHLLGRWASDLLHGDLGTSWVSGHDVLPSVLAGLQVSLALMGAALGVAVLLAAALVAPVLVRGRGSAGAFAAMLAAVPEFLLATVALLVFGVWLGWLPTSGWAGPAHLVLPALALGVPAGGLLGRLVADALPAVLDERWVELWRGAGVRRTRISGAALKRVLPPLVPQFGMAAVGLAGGAVAVELVFAVPGIGRTALGAARSQDLPLLQGSVLALLLLGLVAGAAAAFARRRLLGPALRDAGLTLPPPRPVRTHPAVPAALFTVLAVTVGWGLLRDPYSVDTAVRLAAPSWAHPLGTDALGRDVLARLGHGAASTVGTAAAICLTGLVTALALGFLPGVAAGASDIANALPPVIVGILVAAATGPGTGGAALAVALISWPALSAHAAALVQEVRASAFLTAQRAIGAPPWWILTRHVLPSVAAPVARHALLRLPGIALALASLGFLGLGAQPPAPEWGLLLDESRAYVERAPWAALAPAVALALLAGLAVSGASYTQGRGFQARGSRGRGFARTRQEAGVGV
ncbi:peptide/nickel transport system permease protein [Streptomyces sp. SAI-117]|uniref:ABC transporter permease subunit n=1 Tax=unclassified Streptomyces TaxID=2593676 RepID=UPI002473709E|nr:MULTISPECIES: ABC transporter permease subunit [unclassified Streptomyces]MDH6548501.1 peptide/nickel transport system permease protein [Streptomyces sp. SAI-041]MDH6567595.1 peptide/nickel transport system permease protein [Streptomyces sp. SAI-117]MDH6587476.1 peptide/nickel transport system permease protein [Streptomyces sp. SAI-133]